MRKLNLTLVLAVLFISPLTSQAVFLGRQIYNPKGAIPFFHSNCTSPNINAIILYDLTSGSTEGGFSCTAPQDGDLVETYGSEIFMDNHEYSILEVSVDGICDSVTYAECKAKPEFVNEFKFKLSQLSLAEAMPVVKKKDTISPQSNSIFTRDLDPGTRGDDVLRLQNILKSQAGIYPEGFVTGYFGPLTQKSVERFQSKYGLVSGGSPNTTGFGRVGSKTRAKLNEIAGGVPGSVSAEEQKIIELQDQLRALQAQIQEILQRR